MIEEAQIRIRKINHAFIRIESDMSIAMEISEKFKFMVAGAKFSPAFKMGKWDGFIKLFNLGTRLMASGLYSAVIEFAESREYTVEIVDDSEETGYTPPGYQTPGITREAVLSYMEDLDLRCGGKPITIRDYQVEGVLVALRDRQAILKATTGAGKSLILYCVARYITEVLGLRVLIIVPTVSLTTQFLNDFKDYSSNGDFDVDKTVHLISAGIDKNVDKPIVISTFQSLTGIPKDWLNDFGAIISDEGHKIQAKSFQDIYGAAIEVPFRLTCTGTLSDTKCDILVMQGLTGAIHIIAEAKDLIEAGQLAPMKIKAVTLNYSKDVRKLFKKIVYEDEIKWITTNPKRNNFIKKLSVSCKGTTLVLFRFVEQGKILYDLVKSTVGDTREVHLIDGSVDKDQREFIRVSSNSNDAIIIGSFGTVSTGINLPSIENIIFGHPLKSKLTFLQAIGRGLRLKTGKTHCNLFVIGDSLGSKTKANTTYNHFGDVLKLLISEGYEFDQVSLDF